MDKKMMEEAAKRLQILQKMELWDEVLEYWEKGTACFSKPMVLMDEVVGVTFTFNEDEELKKIKEKLEKEKEIKVYYGIYNKNAFGRMILFFYVSSDQELWEMERKGIKNGYADVYCYNLEEASGEFGSIGFEMAGGGLVWTE